RRLPLSTCFPYTTLFRSGLEPVEVLALARRIRVLENRGAGVPELGDSRLGLGVLADVDLAEDPIVAGQLALEPNAGSTAGLGVEDDVVHFFSFFLPFLDLRLATFSKRRLRAAAVMRNPPGNSPTAQCP